MYMHPALISILKWTMAIGLMVYALCQIAGLYRGLAMVY